VGTLEKCQTGNGTCLQATLLNDKTMQKTRAFAYAYAPSSLFDAETMFSPGATCMRNVNFSTHLKIIHCNMDTYNSGSSIALVLVTAGTPGAETSQHVTCIHSTNAQNTCNKSNENAQQTIQQKQMSESNTVPPG
jgi:hypothetical protein